MFCCLGSKCGFLAIAGAGLLGASIATISTGQPEGGQPESPPEGMPDMQAMMEMMREAARPDEHHKALEPLIGTWDAVAVFAEGTPMEMATKGTAETTWELGGRVQRSVYHMEDFLGEPFTGIGYTGYDKVKGEYWSVWMDTMGTGVFTETGSMSEDGKTLTMSGVGTMPMGEVPMKHVTRISDDKYVLEFYEPDPATGEMAKSGSITFTRAQ